MPEDIQNIEEEVMESNIDPELRNEISQAKQPIDKKWIYIGAAALGIIVIGLLVYFLAFANTKSTFDIYYNKEPVNVNLDVKITLNGETTDYITDKNVLLLSLPKDSKFDFEITTKGYELKKTLIWQEYYRIDITKMVNLADNIDPKPQDVKISVYTSEDSFNVYSSPVTLYLKCLSSSKSDSLTVTGNGTYSKATDCGTLNISANVTGYNAYSKNCNEPYCSVTLSKVNALPITETKNNLKVFVIEQKSKTPIEDVNVTVSKSGFTQMLTTDILGQVEFVDLATGDYVITTLAEHDGKSYSKTTSVSVVVDALAISKTIEYNFVDGNFISLFIDANEDLHCNFAVEIFDNEKAVIPSDGDLLSFDANKTQYISSDDLNSGIHYLTVAPLDDCATIYAPIYNKSFNYPTESDLKVTMLPFEKAKQFFLYVKPKYDGITVGIKESDTNRFILSDNESDSGIYGPFILYQDVKYDIVGDSEFAYGTLEDFKFNSTIEADEDGYYSQTVDLPLTIKWAPITINANILDDSNIDFTVLAIWDSPLISSKSKDFDGVNGVAEIWAPSGIPVLLKLYADVNINDGFENQEFRINYYFNKMSFPTTKTDLNVNLSKNYFGSFDSGIIGPKQNNTYYLDQYLNKKNLLEDSKLTNNTEYYIPFDVLGSDYNSDLSSKCVSNGNKGVGFVFGAQVSDVNKLKILDILSYDYDSSVKSLTGKDFKKTFVAISNEKEINIFRVLVKAKVLDVKVNQKGSMNYGVDYDVVPKSLSKSIYDFKVSKTKTTNESTDDIYTMTINLFTETQGKLKLPIDTTINSLLSSNSKYIVSDLNWSPSNTLVECDPDVSLLDDYISKLGLNTAFIGKEIDKDGFVSDTITPNDELKNTLLPLILNVQLETTIKKEGSDSEHKYPLSLVLILNRGDYAPVDCLETKIEYSNGNPIDILNIKYVNENDNLVAYYKSFKIDDLTYTQDQLLSLSSNNNLDSQETIETLYDVIFDTPNKLLISSKCNLWNYDITYASGDDTVKQKSILGIGDIELLVSNDTNLFFITSFVKNVDATEDMKFNSLQMVYAPKPIDDQFKLESNSKTSKIDGNIIPLETSITNPDCTKNMCSRQMFDKFNDHNSEEIIDIYLMDDNIIPNHSYDGHYSGFGLYSYSNITPSLNNWVIYKDVDIQDHLFYHLPFRSEFQNLGNFVNSGTCIRNLKQLSYGNYYYFQDNNCYIDLNLIINNKFNNLTDVKSGLFGQIKDNNWLSNGIMITSGLNLTKTSDVKLLNIEDKNKFVNNTFLDKKYYVMKNNHYYNTNQLFTLLGNTIYPRTQSYTLISLEPSKLKSDKYSFLKSDYISGTGYIYDLEKVLTQYNQGNLVFYYNDKDYDFLDYNYEWNLNQIFTNESLSIIFKTFDDIFVISSNNSILDQLNNQYNMNQITNNDYTNPVGNNIGNKLVE